jgi:purine-nucleoside phosphorylase
MSIHISAKAGEIAPVVLMPGDPLRAKFIAENYLQKSTLVSNTRNVLFYTGLYNGKTISVGASGMGCPSIGIYSFELYTEFNVSTIIRIGTCGAYTTDTKLFDLINVDIAASESTFAAHAWGIQGETIAHQGEIFNTINKKAVELNTPLIQANIHSSDIFYRKDPNTPAIAIKNNCIAVEMESFSLFANAKYLGKNAATLLTVTDIIPTHERLTAEQREKALDPMIKLALAATL